MLSVVISASDDAGALARLLAALVEGVTAELVADVVVWGASGLSRAVADEAGATLAEAGDLAAAVGLARGRWIAGLPLGAALAPGWIEAVAEHMGRTPPAPARLLAPGRFLLRRRPQGWLVPKSAAILGVSEEDLERLAGLGGARRLRVLA
ncbi:MAG: cell wall biosynthesis glycosyltransferase [Caulobacteraceae bacterium]|nr:cell wall biosynthesis glycosyltransferase [Caulobacteraceae bacterium]